MMEYCISYKRFKRCAQYLKIFTQSSSKNLKTIANGTRYLHHTAQYNFRVYFLRGCDARHLNSQIQTEFLNYIKLDRFGNSFLMYNSLEVQNKMRTWKQRLPHITPYYAVKSNPIEYIISDVINGPFGTFDCASKGEIQLILKHGVPANKIVYSNPVKSEKDLSYAYSKGISITTADTTDELLKIQQIAPKMKILWRLSIKEDNPEELATVFSGKFGDDLTIDQAQERFQQIRKMGIKLHGLHFHCGSAVQGSPSFGKGVELAKECMRIGRECGHRMELLDVGGGFPSGDIHENAISSLNFKSDFEIIAEPGRHFSGNSCQLLFRILTKRIKSSKLCYHVNESLYHSFNNILMDGVSFEGHSDQFYSAINDDGSQVSLNNQGNGSLFGMTCDGRDVIVENMRLPLDMQVGDWLCMNGLGAYTVGPKSSFNGMKATSKVYKWSGEYVETLSPKELIRETA